MSETLVCWVATEAIDDEGNAIEFHPEGPDERESREGVPMRRAPEFDAHAPGPVPLAALLAAGWQAACSYCGHMLDPDDACEQCAEECFDDGCDNCWCERCGGPPDHEPEDVAVIVEKEHVWCGPWCRDAEVRRRDARLAQKAAANL